jgi:uncharacterized protein (DUF885 family)
MAYSNLTDAELWDGMAANSKAIADIARYQLGMAKGRIDPAMQAKLIRSDLKTLAKLQREHDAFFVELQRRNSQRGHAARSKRATDAEGTYQDRSRLFTPRPSQHLAVDRQSSAPN